MSVVRRRRTFAETYARPTNGKIVLQPGRRCELSEPPTSKLYLLYLTRDRHDAFRTYNQTLGAVKSLDRPTLDWHVASSTYNQALCALKFLFWFTFGKD